MSSGPTATSHQFGSNPFWKMSPLALSLYWLLLGCCTFLNLTVSATQMQISQRPRFYGVMTTKKVRIHCMSSKQHQNSSVTWHKAKTFDTVKSPIRPGGRIYEYARERHLENAFLILSDLRTEDQGVYFCEIEGVYGPGTEVQVAKPVDLAQALYRSQMKDGLMILQALLLALVIAAFGFRKKTLSDKQDRIYEEPEVDHIYEGLAIETCEEGDLYEEISAYAQAEGAEAPWE